MRLPDRASVTRFTRWLSVATALALAAACAVGPDYHRPSFDAAAQFECTEKIPERIAKKDLRNECTFYAFRITVEKDTAPTAVAAAPAAAASPSSSYRPNDARKAFDDLFKK